MGHSGAEVNSISLSRCGHLLALGMLDARVEVCNLRTVAVVCEELEIGDSEVAVGWGERHLVAASDTEIKSWRLREGRLHEDWCCVGSLFAVERGGAPRKLSVGRRKVAASSMWSSEVVVCYFDDSTAKQRIVETTPLKGPASKVGADAELVTDGLAVIFVTWRLRLYDDALNLVREVDVSGHQQGFRAIAPAQPVLFSTARGLCLTGGRLIQFFTADHALRDVETLGEAQAKAEREMRDDFSLGWSAVTCCEDLVFGALGTWTYSASGKRHRRKAHDLALYCFSPHQEPQRLRPSAESNEFPNCPRLAALACRRNLQVRGRSGGLELLALDEDGFVRRSSTRFETTWPGPFFPVGFEKLDDNVEYHEPETEMDFVDGVEQVTAKSKDLEECQGYARATFDDELITILPNEMQPLDHSTWLAASIPGALLNADPKRKRDDQTPVSNADSNYVAKFRRLFGMNASGSDRHDPPRHKK